MHLKPRARSSDTVVIATKNQEIYMTDLEPTTLFMLAALAPSVLRALRKVPFSIRIVVKAGRG